MDQDRLVGVIDFEHARLADPLYDFVKLFSTTFPLSAGLEEGFLAGYEFDPAEPSLMPRFAAVQLLEALSAISYHHKRSNDRAIELQRLQIEMLLDESPHTGSLWP